MQLAFKGRFEALVKSLGMSGDSLLIDGFASTPDPDRGDDITLPEAFSKTLLEYMQNPILFWDHGQDSNYNSLPIGKVTKAAIEAGGLHIQAEVSDPIIAAKIRAGELRTLSFGYEVPEGGIEYVQAEGRTLRIIKELHLYEISIVAIPMNPAATFSMAKSLKAYFASVDAEAKRMNATTTPVTPNDSVMPEETTEPATEEKTAVEVVTPEVVVEVPAEGASEVKADEAQAPVVADEPKTVQENEAPVPASEPKADDTADETPPNEEKRVNDSTPIETKSIPSTEEKAYAAKDVELDVKALTGTVATLTKRLADAEEKAATIASEYQKADHAISLLTDMVVQLKKLSDETPVETPYAVSPGLQSQSTSKKSQPLDNLRLISSNG